MRAKKTKTEVRRTQIAEAARPETLMLHPEQLLSIRTEDLGLTKLLEGWDEDLEAEGKGKLGLVKMWKQMGELRAELLGSLEDLTHFPLEWLAGNSMEAAPNKRSYIRLSAIRTLLLGHERKIVSQIFGRTEEDDDDDDVYTRY